MLAVFIVSMVFWIILGVANGGFVLYGPVAMPLAYTAFMVVGALIVAHRPGNAMGWLFSALGLLAAIMFLALEYATFAYYTRPGPWPGAIVAAWLSAWAVIPLSGLTVTFTLLLFPSGRLLSPRWRVVAWLAAMDLAAVTAVAALGPTLPTVGVPNPIGVAGMPDLQQGAVGNALRLLGYALPLAACASLVVRFRRSQEWSASSSSGSRTLLCCWSPLHRRYNAARTVEGFSGRLRDEIDLDTLSAELLAVVDQTMQPTAVSLWLRPSVQTPSRTEG
jgi:hypothetical protein